MKKINENFSVIILVGGQGSRFSKKEAPPKHLSKLNKNLILVNIINYLKKFGFRHFIFPLGYKKEYFVEFFNSNYNQRNFNFKILKKKVDISDLKLKKLSISFFDAGKNTSKMTRIFKSKKYSNSNLLIVYGDDLANVNLDPKLKIFFLQIKKRKQ
jgi:glucose-1-phosphate cytidylyltransferase